MMAQGGSFAKKSGRGFSETFSLFPSLSSWCLQKEKLWRNLAEIIVRVKKDYQLQIIVTVLFLKINTVMHQQSADETVDANATLCVLGKIRQNSLNSHFFPN